MLCLSSSRVPYAASFPWFTTFDCPSVFSYVCLRHICRFRKRVSPLQLLQNGKYPTLHTFPVAIKKCCSSPPSFLYSLGILLNLFTSSVCSKRLIEFKWPSINQQLRSKRSIWPILKKDWIVDIFYWKLSFWVIYSRKHINDSIYCKTKGKESFQIRRDVGITVWSSNIETGNW